MKKNRRIFIIVFILFLLTVIGFTVDIMNKTTPPWKKKQQTEATE